MKWAKYARDTKERTEGNRDGVLTVCPTTVSFYFGATSDSTSVCTIMENDMLQFSLASVPK